MKLKLKVILGAGALAAIPVIIACLTLGYTASKESQIALQHAAEEHLIAVRDLSKRRVEDYFKTINQQILNLSQNQLTIDAASSFTLGFSRYKKQAKANIEDLKAELSQYYEDQYLNEFKKRNNGKSIDVLSSLEQLSDDAIVLQHSMLQENQYPLGEKNKLADMGNYSSYNRSHKVFHPSFDYYLKQFGYYDIFIVDSETGNIVYSVFKELDYATSLINGPYKNSEIAKVFNKANQAKDESFVAISDFAPYSPSYNDPAAFIASPIFENGKKIAVLIFQMPIDNINQVMTHRHRWQEAGLGNTGETYLVAADKTLRSLNRSMIENKQTYLQDLKNASIDSNIIESIDAKNTSIGLQVANSPKINDALSGQSGLNIYTDYKGLTLLSAYAPISIKGLNWLILSEISVTEAFAPATKLTNEILYLSISLIVILVIVSLAIGYFFANATTAPIIKLSEAINDIQVNSDLTKRLEVNSQDEIGMAANSFNLMLEKFHHDILQVSKASLEIATVSEDTSVISRQTSSTIVDQKNQTQQVATAITKMSATLNDVSVNISHTAQASEKANIETNTGREMVEHTVTAIQELSEYIQSSSTIIDRVGDDSKKINSVMDVIRSIAEQTNLLALNAAIEAARAGEQGRGFAVVADEVRTLAGRTQQSTLEIQEMIENLQIGAEQAVTAMDKSNQKAQSVVEQANKAGDSLIVIAEAVARINDMSTQIASAAEQQNTVNEDINNNILSIHDLAEQTATGAEKTTTSTKKLSLLAEELNVMVKEFTV